LEDAEHREDRPQEGIYRIGLRDLLSAQRLRQIYGGGADYYWSDEWSPEFFVAQAKAGFISISYETGQEELGQVLMPQIHTANAVLDWEDLHLSKSTRRWMRSERFREAGYQLSIDHPLGEVVEGIACYQWELWTGKVPYLGERWGM